MTTYTRFRLGLLLVAGLGTPASAAVVSFTGSISIVIGLPGLPSLSVPGGGLATINGSAGTTTPITRLALAAGAFAGAPTVPFPNQFPIVVLAVSASNPAAVFSSAQSPCDTAHSQVSCSGGGLLHGRAGLVGTALVGLFGTASAPFLNLTVPLSRVGGGSTVFDSNYVTVTIMLQGAGWTTGNVAIVNKTFSGSPSTVTVTGGQTNLGPNTHRVVLVTPISFFANFVGPGSYLPSFAIWTVNLQLPEPGTLLLLGTAALGLWGFGWRRRR